MELKQYDPEQAMDQKRNQKGSKKILRQMKMETQYVNTYRMQQKQF